MFCNIKFVPNRLISTSTLLQVSECMTLLLLLLTAPAAASAAADVALLLLALDKLILLDKP